MVDIQLADVDSTKVPGKEISRRPIILARVAIKNANYWEQFGGSI